MSRTWKDEPLHKRAAENRKGMPLYVYHRHDWLGKPRFETLTIYDEDSATPSRVDGKPETVRLHVGYYADYCTGYMNPDTLPENTYAPCRTWFRRMQQGSRRWKDAARLEWRRGDRQASRLALQRLAREHGPLELNDDDLPDGRHRHMSSWWM